MSVAQRLERDEKLRGKLRNFLPKMRQMADKGLLIVFLDRLNDIQDTLNSLKNDLHIIGGDE